MCEGEGRAGETGSCVHYPGITSTDMCICVWLCVPVVVAVNVVTSQCRSALCACLPNTAHTPPQTF